MTALAACEYFLPVGSGRLFVREIGAGGPLLVLHGGPSFDHQYLLPEFDELAGAFRLTYYAQRGRGGSYAGEGPGDVNLRSELRDLDQVRRRTGEEPVTLLGHSWGGLLALEYALENAIHVSHLVLLSPAPVSRAGYLAFVRELQERRSPEDARVLADLAGDPEYLAGDLAKDAEAHRAHFACTVRDPAYLPELARRCQANTTREGVRAARTIGAALMAETWGREDYDLTNRLREFDVPTLIITGDNDFIPMSVMREINEAIPGSRLEVIAGAGHFSYLERLGRLTELVGDFAA